MAINNALWGEDVAAPDKQSDRTFAIGAFNPMVMSEPLHA